MKSNKRRTVLAGLATICLAVAGCGSDSGGDPTSGSSDPVHAATGTPVGPTGSGTGSAPSAAGSSVSAGTTGSGGVNEAARAMLPAKIREAGVVQVESTMGYPPAEFYEEDGKTPTGYSVELGEALGRKLGVRFEFTNTAFAALVPGITSGRFDIGITEMSITDERRKQVSFIKYFNAGTMILVQAGNPKNIHRMADLCGVKVGSTKGANNVQKVIAYSDANCGDKPAEIVWFDDTPAVFQAIQTGRIDAEYDDFPAMKYAAAHSDGKLEAVGDIEYGFPKGMPIAKDNTGLGNAVTAALNDLIEAGEYHRILDKWGVADGAVDKAEFLPATG